MADDKNFKDQVEALEWAANAAQADGAWVFVHSPDQAGQEHINGEGCWCSPLRLSPQQAREAAQEMRKIGIPHIHEIGDAQ